MYVIYHPYFSPGSKVFATYKFWSGEQVIKVLVKLRRNASVLDQLDVACSFARFAHEQDLVRPILNLGYFHTSRSFSLSFPVRKMLTELVELHTRLLVDAIQWSKPDYGRKEEPSPRMIVLLAMRRGYGL